MATQVTKDNIGDYVGKTLEPSPWLKIEQPRIDAFAEITNDHQFIHVDPERAAQTPFGSTIAHGFLSLSLLSHFGESFMLAIDGAKMGINYGFEKVRFLTPVNVDSEIRGVGKLLEVTEKSPGQFLTKYEVTVEIKGSDKPALIAEWLGMQIVG
jgi:acyl dehydratase